MNLTKALTLAGVPAELHADALDCFAQSKHNHPSHLHKHWIRLTKAWKIASLLEWGDERLIDKHHELADWDIAPVRNVTANGDNLPWDDTGPVKGAGLDGDPESADYQLAVQRNYWLHGVHPRADESRKAWYRRNACEYEAWRKGVAIDPALLPQVWSANGVTVLHSGGVWQAYGTLPILGPIRWKFDVGYEVGNVFAFVNDKWVQSWYPLPGHELRACVCWVVYPTFGK